MKTSKNIKEALYDACQVHIDKRLSTISDSLASIQESKTSDSKSSVGDKYETGRAMLHLEEEKNRRQLLEATQVKNDLLKIDIKKQSSIIELGSLVKMSNGIFFISVGVGKITLEEEVYFCISTSSPIGKLLLGKKQGDKISFNGNTFEILEVS